MVAPSSDSKKRRLRLCVIWLLLGMAFAYFGVSDLVSGRASLRVGHQYSRDSEPGMFWLITSAHFGMATWLFWKAATQRAESDEKNA